MKKVKITAAYCVELGKIIEIEEAHEASMERDGTRFKFLCSSEECRKREIPITGVLYHLPRHKQSKAIHFRDNDANKHHESCEWFITNEYISFEGKHKGETDEEAEQRRKLHSLLEHDFIITNYNPYNPDAGVKTEDSIEKKLNRKPRESHSASTQNIDKNLINKRFRTSSFYKLIRCHYELAKKFSNNNLEKFKQIPLNVRSMKTTYFQHFKVLSYYQNTSNFKGITYGYVSNITTRYGYRVYMVSKIKGLSVFFLIPSSVIDTYRSRREILEVLEHYDKFKDVQAYFVPDSIDEVTMKSGQKEVAPFA